MNNQSPLFNNKFVNNFDIPETSSTDSAQFRRFYESKINEQQKQSVLNGYQYQQQLPHQQQQQHQQPQLPTTYAQPFKSPGIHGQADKPLRKASQNEKYSSIQKNSIGIGIESTENKIFQKEKTTIVAVSTSERDHNKDPDPNNFEVFLGKTFTNVKKIELVSTEIPISDNVIKDFPIQLQNNLITWINEEDYDLNFFTGLTINTIVADTIDITLTGHGKTIGKNINIDIYNSKLNSDSSVTGIIDGKKEVLVLDANTLRLPYTNGLADQGTASINLGYPSYTVSIKPGNYSALTLVNQISSDLGLIKRRNGTGQFHYFDVNVDLNTDLLTLDSVIITQLGTDPLYTTAGSTIISVNHLNHGLKTGDRVKMVGVRNLAGIASEELNGNYNITVIDFNTYTYEVITRANATSTGGGTTTQSGRDAPFILLFDSTNTLIQFNTGFPNEDSTESINQSNPITTKILTLSDAQIINRSTVRLTTTEPHLLDPCNIIDIINTSIGHNPTITTNTPHLLALPTRITIRNSNNKIDGTSMATPSGPYTLVIEGITTKTVGTTGQILYGGDSISTFGLRCIPNIDYISEFFVENTPTDTQFDITFFISSIDSGSIASAIIQTSQITVTHPNHLFNNLSNIIEYNSTFANCTTQLPHSYIGSRNTLVTVIDGPINTNTVDILLYSHGLVTSDTIIIKDSTSVPSVDGIYKIQVIDLDTIRINFVHVPFVTGSSTILAGDTIIISDSRSLPRIDGSYSIHNRELISNTGTATMNSSLVVDTYESIDYWEVGDNILIVDSDFIDGTYTVESINVNSFTVIVPFDVTTPSSTGAIINTSRFVIDVATTIINPGTSSGTQQAAMLGRTQDIIFYRIEADDPGGNTIGGITLQAFNGVYRPVQRLIDINTYMIRTNNNYATKNITAGGSDVRVSSLQHGKRSIQANTDTGDTTGKLYRSINLIGTSFIYLVCQGLDCVLNGSGIDNVFAKILLSELPGFEIHNSFVSTPKIFDNPISRLETLRFKVVDNLNYPYNFNKLNYSFSLLITEIIQQQESAYISSHTGRNERNIMDTKVNKYY